MSPRLTLESVDEVPCDARVCHYDELAEPAKEEFPELTGDGAGTVERTVADGFRECDLVKFTDYYAVAVGEGPS